MDIAGLEKHTVDELRDIAREMSVTGHTRLKKDDLIMRILAAQAQEMG
ncbi:MAG TPA: Rho termination factor N-terminal domain-containing protein, partial [Anaerolineae bacterium]|nr:Rho termination factor N-terminal domain-containing protein [Anaerolineae bacterium]